jgi:hypothetical protein
MRDKGFRFHLYEPVAPNLFARNCYADCKLFGEYRALTAIEVFEHFVSPADALAEMLDFSRSVIFTTELCPVPRPMPHGWWYFGPEHGQHVSFYTEGALKHLGAQHGLEYCHLGSNWHILAPYDDPILAFASSKGARSNGRGVLSIARFSQLANKFLIGGGERASLREHDFNAMRQIMASADSMAETAQAHIDQLH